MLYLKIDSFAKNFLWKSYQLLHMVVRELLRLPDNLKKLLFCQSDISRIELQSNWTVDEFLLFSDQLQFVNPG